MSESPTSWAGADSNERGAVAVIVALCAVVLLGMAAWVIDGGALYQERRELQRGADFAALTVAADCARGVYACPVDIGDAISTAEGVVDANSTDDRSDIPPGGVTFPTPNQVRVQVVTFDARANIDGDTSTVDFMFARVFGSNGLSVRAEATAQWDVVGAASTLALTLSYCEWDDAYDPEGAGEPVTIYFHDGTQGNGNLDETDVANGDACPVGPAGLDVDENMDGFLPAGFGWLNEDDCVANLNVVGEPPNAHTWVARQGGNAPPNGCDPPAIESTIILPVFIDYVFVNGDGWTNQCGLGGSGVGCYHIEGWAAFHLLGIKFPGGPAWRQGDISLCSGPISCITGYFTLELCDQSDCSGSGGTNLGAMTVRLVG